MYSPKLSYDKSLLLEMLDGIEAEKTDGSPEAVTRETEYLASLLSFSDKESARSYAELLLSRYGSLDGIFFASADELTELIGEKSALFIKIIAALNSRRVTDRVKPGKLYSLDEIISYTVAAFIGQSTEAVYLLSFDKDGKFVGMDRLGEGTVNSSDVYPRKIAEAAARRRAKFAILAHNHPFGTANPSDTDIISTTRLYVTALTFGVLITHHVIVAERDYSLLEVDKDTGEVINRGKNTQKER